MEELLMSFKLKALYPLTGGYNRHSINPFYEEFVRPTEIKGLWRWWNRVLFNTVSHAKDGRLYTYDSIDRLFEDVFGSENKKSAVRLEVIAEESENSLNVELDEEVNRQVINCLKRKDFGNKAKLDIEDDNLIIKPIEDKNKRKNSCIIHLSFRSNLNDEIKKKIIDNNKLLKFELLGFKSIKINPTKISNDNSLKEILRNLITDYMAYFNIKPVIEFTLNIYLDRSREKEQNFNDKLKFALYSLLVFILLGGIGRKTSRGFGSLSFADVKCYNEELCGEISNIMNRNNMEKQIKNWGLTKVLRNIIFNDTIRGYFDNLINDESYKLKYQGNNPEFFVYYFVNDINILKIININQDRIETILDKISNETSIYGECIKKLISQEMRRRAFTFAFLGNRKFRNKHKNYARILEFLCVEYIKREFVNLIGKERRPSNLRFKILEINNTYYIISYLLYSNYLKNTDPIIKDMLNQFVNCVIRNVYK
ncbi:type III-B CRISPR module RAMP protein Cmr1 [Sulfolobus sp. S-194]|uniref:type III-B CRISPR module RAMP protein Cmr1 n=1 Tax=Sulfolobus sp. S-194 TaxID=2512240 RepID=UPI0014372424|nr:type III-B CRISPR module RAMP protein Cmr1 [Sulfolobus sp. S-194]QIW24503.1 type III-B CRISPR module RAMP protein Cmr1 [Sulfolobus sp. S-194]